MNDNSPQPQRVLVTGASGAIGTPVCRHLLARGHHVRSLYHNLRRRGRSRGPTTGAGQQLTGY
jgi:uncharacterized protein YbjT (DUF2867 family)